MAQNAAPHSVQPTAEPVRQHTPTPDDFREATRLLVLWSEIPGAEDMGPGHDTFAFLGKENSAGWIWAAEVKQERDFDAEQARQRDLTMQCICEAEAESASLKARAEQAEQEVDVLESNARVQAKLLADTGRRVEELEAQQNRLVDWAVLYASEGQSWVFSSVTEQLIALSSRVPTQADAEHFRKRGSLAALPPSSSTGLTDMTLKARNDALHENNVLALRQIEELKAALRNARGFIDPDANPPRTSNREMVAIIDAALPPSTPAVSR